MRQAYQSNCPICRTLAPGHERFTDGSRNGKKRSSRCQAIPSGVDAIENEIDADHQDVGDIEPRGIGQGAGLAVSVELAEEADEVADEDEQLEDDALPLGRFRSQGLGDVVKDIIELPQGIYQLSYTSAMSTNFGTNYLPVEAEVYLLNRSGRDETGYFAPLQ